MNKNEQIVIENEELIEFEWEDFSIIYSKDSNMWDAEIPNYEEGGEEVIILEDLSQNIKFTETLELLNQEVSVELFEQYKLIGENNETS